MQAVRIHTPGPISNLKVERVEIPTPKPDEVLIRNKYAGVNYIDTYHRSGLYTVALPFTLGVDGAGEVYQLGSAVPPELGLTVGTQVAYTSGGAYAEYVAVPANKVAKVPDGIDLGTAAAAMVQGLTALALATQAYPVGQGDWVLVHAAAGGTGQLIVQIAAAAGAHVIGTTSTPEKAELAKSLGAEHVILSGRPDVAEEVLRITGGQGVHVVYDGVGKNTWETSKKALRHLGTLVTFGNASGKVEPFELATLTPRNIKIMRPSLFEFIKASPTGFADLTSQIFGLIKSGKLKLHVQRVYPLHEAYRAHEDLEGRRTTGKLLLEITPAPTAAA